MKKFEIERKFLIAMPDLQWLSGKALRRLEMVQTYLLAADGESSRVRKITENGTVTYIQTMKKRISNIKRLETEAEITAEEYATLLEKADSARRPIRKVRYCVPHGRHMLEIDIFSFWQDKAFLEVELVDEKEEISLPSEFIVLREVTEDRRYTNAALAKELPE